MNFIKKIILWILASWFAFYATQYYFPDYISIWWWIEAFAFIWIIFWILNSILKPILKLVALPFIFLTAGLFTFVINWAIIYFTEYFFEMIPSLWASLKIIWWLESYIFISVVLWVINYLTHWLVDVKG